MIFRSKEITYISYYRLWMDGYVRHRKLGPAVIWYNGYKEWYKNGIKVK